MRILIIDDKVPDPSFCAGFPRAYRLLMSLINMGHECHFLPTLKDTLSGLDYEKLRDYGINVCEDITNLSDIDVAILSRPHNVHYYLPKVKRHLPNAKTIYDTEALWFRRYDLQLSITGRLPGWAYRYDEIGMALSVDLCYVVNNEEKIILESHGVKKVIVLGHSLDIDSNGLPFQERKDFLVVGGYLEEDSSNEDALWHYLQNAWDYVHADTQSHLWITGRATAPRLLAHAQNTPSLTLMGHVPSLPELYQKHRVFVASTRFATGIPWKVHEAMAYGIPCIISPLLQKQLGVTDGVEALVAYNNREYVEKSQLLYQDENLWNQIRQNGFNLIRKDCCPDKFKNIIQLSLNNL